MSNFHLTKFPEPLDPNSNFFKCKGIDSLPQTLILIS